VTKTCKSGFVHKYRSYKYANRVVRTVLLTSFHIQPFTCIDATIQIALVITNESCATDVEGDHVIHYRTWSHLWVLQCKACHRTVWY